LVARITREFCGIRVETTHWPIVLVEFPEKRVPDAEFHQALAFIEQLMRACVTDREKSYQITDITRIREIPPATQRRYAADFLKRNSNLALAASFGTANVTPSSILRGVMTAVFWISRPPTPVTFFETRDQAFLHACDVLEQGGAQLTPPLLELRARATSKLHAQRAVARPPRTGSG
jgi:hypothetical protein